MRKRIASCPLVAWMACAPALVWACAAEPSTATDAAAATRPSFVLLMADDQGWGELSLRGHPYVETPELDAMAAAGVSLERFYAAAPVCSPTRASVLTGRHPSRVGCLAWGHEVPGEEETLAELLRAEGYATGHFGKWHVGSVQADAATSPGAQGFDEWLSSPNFFDLDPLMSARGEVVATQGEGSEVVMDAALGFIEESVRSTQPFLAVVWFASPHDPHVARPEELAERAHVPQELRAYCAELEALDGSVGRLRSELRRLGIERSTLVWYTSDNGPRPPRVPDKPGLEGDAHRSASTGGLRGAKGSLWDGGLRVPSLLEGPGVLPRGAFLQGLAGTVDILPTVLDLAGVAGPRERVLDGESLRPLLSGSSWRRSAPLGFWMPPAKGRAMYSDRILRAQRDGQPNPSGPAPFADRRPALDPQSGPAAWIEGSLKLHRLVVGGEFRYELYDLREDPWEEVDLAPAQPAELRRLRADLERWLADAAADRERR